MNWGQSKNYLEVSTLTPNIKYHVFVGLGIIDLRYGYLKKDQGVRLHDFEEAGNCKKFKESDPLIHTINAPSTTLSQFPALYDGLIEFDKALRSYNFQ